MVKLIIIFLLFFFISPARVFAQSNSFVSIVNPVRGTDFWELKEQSPHTAILAQVEILKKFNLAATWLIRFDALSDEKIISILKSRQDEKGLFLEITPSLSRTSGVPYHDKKNWHDAASAFLTGYERKEREKIIDSSFEKFKELFGEYPTSVGAWWIDSYSINYMQKKYGVSAVLIVADQYTTDNYQIWGQYFGAPYYPSKTNSLHPAGSLERKLPVVMIQWAVRDPVNGYGDGVGQSTFSVQANDYIDYHNLDTNYFKELIDIYTKQQFNQFGQVVVGLENSYEWEVYGKEYENQMKLLKEMQEKGKVRIVRLGEFASWYIKTFPELSPEHLIFADDPLGTYKKVLWFMNPYYRAGWFLNQDGSVFRDIRQYVEGVEEPCFTKKCSELNFATFATRVLDDVTYQQKLVVDAGNIRDFKIGKESGSYVISYKNEAGNTRKILFAPKDIGIDGKLSSIDQTILTTIQQSTSGVKVLNIGERGSFQWSITSVLLKFFKLLGFLIIVCIIPGLVAVRIFFGSRPNILGLFLAMIVGLVNLALIFYLVSIAELKFLVFIYLLVCLIVFIRLKLYLLELKFSIERFHVAAITLIICGSIFLSIPMVKNGLLYPFGLGFWGPNTHDGVWHLSLINQLIESVPPENPIFADTTLKNYHFFYDLLIAATSYLSTVPPMDLVFRFYPVIFSLLLGIGTYYLIKNFFKDKWAALFGLYFVYFAGSFGWIVSYIKEGTFAGESAFWANQSISFNLNPPFAISLLIIITLLHVLFISHKLSIKAIFFAGILAGSLVGFKAYAGILILGSLLILAILKKRVQFFCVSIMGIFISALIFLSNFHIAGSLIIFAPFWLIHSMVDSPDRVGWVRLSLARQVGFEQGNWFKLVLAESLGLALFLVGNLGVRVISIASLKGIKKIFGSTFSLFLLILSTISLTIPILFIQSGNPWNTIQFAYYGLYITALIAGLSLSRMLIKLAKPISYSIAIIVLIITPINSFVTASYYTGYLPHGRIEQEEIEALEFLSKQEDGTVLTYPFDKRITQKIAEPRPLFAYDSTSYVSAFSKKSTYLEDESQNEILLTGYKKRVVASKDLFHFQVNGKDFLRENNIKYIYLPKLLNVSLDTNLLGTEKIFENERVVIFKTK